MISAELLIKMNARLQQITSGNFNDVSNIFERLDFIIFTGNLRQLPPVW